MMKMMKKLSGEKRRDVALDDGTVGRSMSEAKSRNDENKVGADAKQ